MKIRTCLLLAGALGLSALHADWPTYRADATRSGVATDPVLPPLAEVWRFESPNPPSPMSRGPAKWDGWHKVRGLKDRQTFDRAFHVVAAGGRAFFGSSADDKVYALDTATGRELWSFYTEGPVRLAPTLDGDSLYVGSDDGHVYRLRQEDGHLVWKTRIGPRDFRIPGNGRLISAWPVRTGVLVRDDTVYAAAGMFPSEGVHITAVDARTGETRWRTVQEDLPALGYLLASETRLYVPAGRDNPVVLDRAGGERLRVVEGSGGTYALLTDDTLVFGPGKTGQLGVVENESRDQIASFSGNHMIVTPGMSFLHSDTELTALDRARYLDLARQRREIARQQSERNKELKALGDAGDSPEAGRLREDLAALGAELDRLSQGMADCVAWKQPCSHRFSIILAGDSLWVGGEDVVAAIDRTTGTEKWSGSVTGNAYGIAADNGFLFVSTDRGTVHAFAPAKASQARVLPLQVRP